MPGEGPLRSSEGWDVGFGAVVDVGGGSPDLQVEAGSLGLQPGAAESAVPPASSGPSGPQELGQQRGL